MSIETILNSPEIYEPINTTLSSPRLINKTALIDQLAQKGIEEIAALETGKQDLKSVHAQTEKWIELFSEDIQDLCSRKKPETAALIQDIRQEVINTIRLKLGSKGLLSNEAKMDSMLNFLQSLMTDFEKAQMEYLKDKKEEQQCIRKLKIKAEELECLHKKNEKKSPEAERESSRNKKQTIRELNQPPSQHHLGNFFDTTDELFNPLLSEEHQLEFLEMLPLSTSQEASLVPLKNQSLITKITLDQEAEVVDVISRACYQLIGIDGAPQERYQSFRQLHRNCEMIAPLVDQTFDKYTDSAAPEMREKCRAIARKVNQNIQLKVQLSGNLIHDQKIEKTKQKVRSFSRDFQECQKQYIKDRQESEASLEELREKFESFREIENDINGLRADLEKGLSHEALIEKASYIRDKIYEVEDPIARAVLTGLLIAVVVIIVFGTIGGLIATFAVSAPVAAGIAIGAGVGALVGGVTGGAVGDHIRESSKSAQRKSNDLYNNPKNHFEML